MLEAIKCQAADRAYIKALAALEIQCFSEPWSEEAITDFLSYAHNFALLLADGDTVKAYVTCSVSDDVLEVENLAVAPAYRRNGLGMRLLDALETAAKEKQCRSIYLEVRESNTAARALYQKAGFTELCRVNRLFSHPAEAGRRMERIICG